MHNRFDILFSLEILHSKFPAPGVGADMPAVPDFEFEPTSATRQTMRKNGIGAKLGPGRCTVFIEKSVLPDGTFSARSKTDAGLGLNFFLRQKNGALIAETEPFNLPVAQLPAFLGKKRLLYFNSKNEAVGQGGSFWLTAVPVGKESFGSIAPAAFDLKTKNGSVTAIEAKSLAPGSIVVSFAVNAARTASLELPENGYQIAQKPGSDPPEIIFFSPDGLPDRTIGVVQVFPFQAGSSPPQKRYQIFFK